MIVYYFIVNITYILTGLVNNSATLGGAVEGWTLQSSLLSVVAAFNNCLPVHNIKHTEIIKQTGVNLLVDVEIV